MPNYPYSFQLPPLNLQDIPSNGAVGEFLGISAGGVLDWLPVATGGGDMLKSENLSGLSDYAIARTNIGLGTASTPTFANLTLTSPSLSSSAPVTISQTWGTTGTYTAFKVVANETATAAAASNLLELWSGNAATLKLYVRKSGQIIGPDGSATNPTYSFFDGSWGTGFIGWSRYTSGLLCSTSGGTTKPFLITNSNISISRDTVLGWGAGDATGALDTILLRDSTSGNTLALRNGALAQTFNVYGTYSDASNYSRLRIQTLAGFCQLNAEGAGGGINSTLALNTSGTGYLSLRTSSTERFNITASGHFVAAADNAYDIGASGANRPRNLYVGSNIYASGNVGIGTTAPGALLHVVGNGLFGQNATSGTATPVKVSFGGTYGTSTPGSKANLKWDLYNDGALVSNTYGIGMSLGLMEFQTGTAGGFGFYPNASTTSALHIIPSGNVGIGTTSPTSKLHVVGDAVLTGDLLGTNYTIGVPTIITQSNISITNTHSGVADSAIVITPKGVGAFIVGPKPDGTVTGGNARGTRAVDLSTLRTNAANVASGDYAVIGGGYNHISSAVFTTVCGGTDNSATSQRATVTGGQNNTASSNFAFVGGGQSNIASNVWTTIAGGLANVATAAYASILGGHFGLADRHGLNAIASGRFGSNGDAQNTKAVFRNKTTTNTAVELFLDGSSARYTVTSGKIISMLINITGTKSDGSAVAHYVRQYSIKNIGGTTSEVYAAITVGTDNAAGTSIALSADDTNDSLKIEVTGVASETWRWVASVDAVEVGHGV